MYSIDFKHLKEFIHARVTGENSEVNIVSAIKEVENTCHEKGMRRVLIEASLSGPQLSDTAIFEVVNQLISPTALAFDRIAFVNTTPGRDFSSMKFAESVAVNRGVRARVFASVVEAEQWVKQE